MHAIHSIIVGGISTNCWIYPLKNEPGACAVIDPGEEGGRIIAFLDQLKLFPAYILLTHGHFDHIGAVPAFVRKYGKAGSGGPSLAVHAGDADYLGPASFDFHCSSFRIAAGDTAYLDALWEDMPPPDTTLADMDSIGPFTVLHVPGHTPGSAAFWDQSEGLLFSGDTLFSGDYGRTDLPGGSEEQLIASLKRLFAMDAGIQVHPGHGPSTSMGRETALQSAAL